MTTLLSTPPARPGTARHGAVATSSYVSDQATTPVHIAVYPRGRPGTAQVARLSWISQPTTPHGDLATADVTYADFLRAVA
jgi:hypothetical protein